MGGELAEEHGAGVVELGGGRRVLRGNPVDEDARVPRGKDALSVVDVLEGEGNAVERAPRLAPGEIHLGLSRLTARQLEGARDESRGLPVELLDALDQALHELHGRELARGDQAGELSDRQVVQVVGHQGPSSVANLPILLSGGDSVKGPITLKRSVTESEGVASKPVLPPPPERRPRDGTRAPRVCRGDASTVSTGEPGGTRRPVGRVLSGHGRS